MEIFASWDVWGWILALFVPLGVGFAGMNEPRLAKSCFAISALVLEARIIMWGGQVKPSFDNRLLIFCACGLIGVLALEAFRWIDRKKLEPVATDKPPAKPTELSKAPSHEDLSKPVLVFKDSPLFTSKMQTHIRREIVHFRKFLDSLQVEISDEPAAVAVDDKPKSSWKTQASTNGEFYNNLIEIPKDSLNDPKIITERYANYVFWRLAQKDNRWHPGPQKQFDPRNPEQSEWSVEQTEAMFRMSLSFYVGEYLSQSYWNDPAKEAPDLCLHGPESTFNPIPYYLWEIQRAFGKEFANRVAAYAVIAAEKNPLTDKHTTYMRFVTDRILIGEFGVDNDGSKRDAIEKIMNKCEERWRKEGALPKPQ